MERSKKRCFKIVKTFVSIELLIICPFQTFWKRKGQYIIQDYMNCYYFIGKNESKGNISLQSVNWFSISCALKRSDDQLCILKTTLKWHNKVSLDYYQAGFTSSISVLCGKKCMCFTAILWWCYWPYFYSWNTIVGYHYYLAVHSRSPQERSRGKYLTK